MSLETRREIINYLVIFTERELLDVLGYARTIFANRDGTQKYVQNVCECRSDGNKRSV